MGLAHRWGEIVLPVGLLVVFSFALVLPAFGAQKPVLSNLELLRDALREAAQELIEKCPTESLTSPVALLAEDKNDANWLLESVFTEELNKRGLTVLPGGLSKEKQVLPSETEIFYKIIELRILYPRQRRKGFLGAKWLSRVAQVKVTAQLASNGKVIWLDDLNSSVKDEFPLKYLNWVEDDSYPFTKTELKRKDWDKLLEPAIVSAVVGGLVYLFYSNRK